MTLMPRPFSGNGCSAVEVSHIAYSVPSCDVIVVLADKCMPESRPLRIKHCSRGLKRGGAWAWLLLRQWRATVL